MSEEREDWLALQTHPGWLRLLGYAKSQWGIKAYALRLEKADDMTEIKALKLAHGWLDELVNYPELRVGALAHKAEQDHPVATMSRRGSL